MNKDRSDKLEQMIGNHADRILALERVCGNMQADLNNKINIQTMTGELAKKADIGSLKGLQALIMQLQEKINGFYE